MVQQRVRRLAVQLQLTLLAGHTLHQVSQCSVGCAGGKTEQTALLGHAQGAGCPPAFTILVLLLCSGLGSSLRRSSAGGGKGAAAVGKVSGREAELLATVTNLKAALEKAMACSAPSTRHMQVKRQGRLPRLQDGLFDTGGR